MMHDMLLPGIFMWGAVGLVIAVVVAVIVYFARPVRGGTLPIADIADGAAVRFGSGRAARGGMANTASGDFARPRDTIFVFPDISNYTRFMSGNRFSFGHAQHVIFSLINAMIASTAGTLELSKLEGDAALFYVDAGSRSKEDIGRAVLSIFGAFFAERRRLMDANICPCHACSHIEELDLKIFVHRGEAARFEFRGAVDHFGTDVIILHRLMKNSVRGQRYVMVTEAAESSIALPQDLNSFSIEEDVEHVGKLKARVLEIDDATVARLSQEAAGRSTTPLTETLRKLRTNVRSLTHILVRSPGDTDVTARGGEHA